jgi:hypothetical protein
MGKSCARRIVFCYGAGMPDDPDRLTGILSRLSDTLGVLAQDLGRPTDEVRKMVNAQRALIDIVIAIHNDVDILVLRQGPDEGTLPKHTPRV